jgi:hypothetical protein
MMIRWVKSDIGMVRCGLIYDFGNISFQIASNNQRISWHPSPKIPLRMLTLFTNLMC